MIDTHDAYIIIKQYTVYCKKKHEEEYIPIVISCVICWAAVQM